MRTRRIRKQIDEDGTKRKIDASRDTREGGRKKEVGAPWIEEITENTGEN